MNLVQYLEAHNEWSARTFGRDRRPVSIINHIHKELKEVEAAPDDLVEWIDVMILAADGAFIAGYEPTQVAAAVITDIELGITGTWQSAETVISHIKTALCILETSPCDLTQWVKVALFAVRGAYRAGYRAPDVLVALKQKQQVNFARQWPTPGHPDEPTEHLREEEVKL